MHCVKNINLAEISDKQVRISDRRDYGCSMLTITVEFCPWIPQNRLFGLKFCLWMKFSNKIFSDRLKFRKCPCHLSTSNRSETRTCSEVWNMTAAKFRSSSSMLSSAWRHSDDELYTLATASSMTSRNSLHAVSTSPHWWSPWYLS